MTEPKKLSNGAALVVLIEGVSNKLATLDGKVERIQTAIAGDVGSSGLSEQVRALDLKVIGIENERRIEALKALNDVMLKKEEDRYAEVKEFREKVFRWLTAVGAVIGAGSGVTTLLTR